MPKLLVVHDDELIVARLRHCLRRWTVGIAAHGDTAVAEAESFDVIVLDVGRAPFDGWFVLATLGALAAPPQLIVIGAHKWEKRALRLGAMAVAETPECVASALSATAAVA